MLRFFWRSALTMIPTLFLVMAATFVLIRLAPGSPFDGERAWPEPVRKNLEARYGLNQPISTQFGNWLGNFVRGDWGESLQFSGESVRDLMMSGFKTSALLGAFALLISLSVGVGLGLLAAERPGGGFGRAMQFLSLASLSLPSFVFAAVLILIFSRYLGWLPPAGIDSWRGYILPVLTLSLRPIALVGDLVRTSAQTVLIQDYVRGAHAKGLGRITVLFKHVLRPAIVPAVLGIAPMVANLLTGALVVETVFQLPGLGKYFVSAVLNRDYPVVMGVTWTYSLVLVTSTLCCQVCAGLLDPRLSLESSHET